MVSYKSILLKFLADTMNYEEVLTGMDKLSSDQLIVLLEKIKTELKKQGNQSVVIDTTYKEVTNERIEPRSTISEYGNKPESTIECCVYCGSTSIRKSLFTFLFPVNRLV